LIEFGKLVLESKILKNQCIFILLLLSPLGDGQSPPFEQTGIPSSQGRFVASFVKIGQVVQE
jgi:hypothetical protein